MKLFLAISLFTSSIVVADCVYGAKDKTKYTKLDNHSIVLQGGYGNGILIKTYCSIYGSSEVQVLKDDFCSYESAVLYIDGQVCDANQVTKI